MQPARSLRPSCLKVNNSEIELKKPGAERLHGAVFGLDRPVPFLLPPDSARKWRFFKRIRGYSGRFGFLSMWPEKRLNLVE
jgi:hypothetical protein